jgi:hypothetical protein
VDAYNDLNAEADLGVYDKEFNLPPCTTENKCFQKVNQNGGTASLPFPRSKHELETATKGGSSQKEEAEQAEGWALEISTDIEMAHAVCQNCRILLVEANNAGYENLEPAENTAARLLATEISNSWGGPEPGADSAAFQHPGIVVTASSGDDGYLNWTNAAEAEKTRQSYYAGADYPASSPHVVAVGGTKLTLTPGGSWQSETVWNDNHGASGGGCSDYFGAAEWQLDLPDWSLIGCEGRRAVADISADADPSTGVAVYDSTPDGPTAPDWLTVGGTSVSSPIIASMFALAGGARGVEYPARTLYAHLETGLLHAVNAGGNGKCDALYASGCKGSMNPLSAFDCGEGALICNAAAGCTGSYYSGPAGVGTPHGIGVFRPEETPTKTGTACEARGTPGSSPAPPTTENTSTTKSSPTDGASSSTASAAPASSSRELIPVLSGLSLTRTAIVALDRRRPKVSLVAFAFTLNMSARVRVTLARQIRVHGHLRWLLLPDSLTITAAKGRNSRHLTNRAALLAGRYQLTLAPVHGTARSLTFKIA